VVEKKIENSVKYLLEKLFSPPPLNKHSRGYFSRGDVELFKKFSTTFQPLFNQLSTSYQPPK